MEGVYGASTNGESHRNESANFINPMHTEIRDLAEEVANLKDNMRVMTEEMKAKDELIIKLRDNKERMATNGS